MLHNQGSSQRAATVDLVKALTGERVRRRTGRREAPEAHGVLAEQTGPAPPEVAELISKVLGNLIPAIAGDLWRRRDAGPALTNTNGHRLRLITALVNVKDTANVAERLAAHQREGRRHRWRRREGVSEASVSRRGTPISRPCS